MRAYADLIRQAERAVESVGKSWHMKTYPPATQADLDHCESSIGVTLPQSYRAFLSETNGATFGIQLRPLVRYELTLLSSDQVTARTFKRRAYAQQSFPEESFEGLIVFADTMDGDICLFDRLQERDSLVPVLGGSHEDDPDGWRRTLIAVDFDQWYRNVLGYVALYGDHDDFRYWWEPNWNVIH